MTAEVDGSLYLRTVPGDFDPGRDVAAGPWCFTGVEDDHPGWMDLKFVDPFNGSNEVTRAGKNVQQLADSLIPGLAAELNAYHGVAYGTEFWRIVTVYWLYVLISCSWSRYAQTTNLVKASSQRQLCMEICTKERHWHFLNPLDFTMATLTSPNFQWWMDSLILKHLAPSHWELVETPLPDDTATGTKLDPPKFHDGILRRINRAVMHRLGYTDVAGTRLGIYFIALFLNLIPRWRRSNKIHSDENSPPQEMFPQAYLDLLETFMRLTMPASFKEGFAEMATPLANARYRPKRLRIGSLDYVNDRERVAFAFAKENGERLVQVQHGGNYGVAKSVSVEATLEYSQDAFVTWGWTEQEDCVGRFIPLPSPFLGKYANRHCASNNNLLLVGTSIRFRFLRISSTPQPSQYLRYLKDKVSFIGNLTKKPKGCTVYRPYGRGHNDINDARFIETRCPGIAIMEECDHKHFIENHLLKCRLLVLDHNSTTLNVALAANIPTVCFWEDDAWSICRQAQPHFDKLKECKILFHDPVQAAEHVNRVWDDVSAWWNDEKVQQSRREWVGLFALNSRLWWMDWIKILSRL